MAKPEARLPARNDSGTKGRRSRFKYSASQALSH